MSVPDTIAAVKGFRDVLPDESRRWRAFEEAAERLFTRYGFGEIRLPVVERTELFARSLGETTDIVEKEMYSFADRDATGLTLRPEATAGVVRAYLESGLVQSDPTARLFYRGPMFRRERRSSSSTRSAIASAARSTASACGSSGALTWRGSVPTATGAWSATRCACSTARWSRARRSWPARRWWRTACARGAARTWPRCARSSSRSAWTTR